LWRVTVNGDHDPKRRTVFADTYPVVSEINDLVIVRSYLDWNKMWSPNGGAPATVSEIRTYLAQNPELQSFFVLNLADGSQKYVAPVMIGAIGNGGDFMSGPPQAVVKRLADGSDVAYVLWRTRQACLDSNCDGRGDTTFGEMDLSTGNIRFIQDQRTAGAMRVITDEQSPLSMSGSMLFYAHWMMLGDMRIIDRSPGLGGSFQNPIKTEPLKPVSDTLSAGTCSGRSNHACPVGMSPPCDTYQIAPGFYIYYSNQCIYDQFWTTPVRNAVIHNQTIYYKGMDGAIIAVGP
jgi:hypothetical protein